MNQPEVTIMQAYLNKTTSEIRMRLRGKGIIISAQDFNDLIALPLELTYHEEYIVGQMNQILAHSLVMSN